jgi:SAM-dependent methyltransferase
LTGREGRVILPDKMNIADYTAMADELAKEAGVMDGVHGSFRIHRDRLWETISHFGLWNLTGKNVLEIGAFYGYTPFVLRKSGNTVTVLEGDDPAVYPLKPLYARRGIEIIFTDLFDLFGNSSIGKHKLPFPDNHFDLITCWETMEHFNFNPVGFVKEVRRILKPGGIATFTVPNRASLHHRIKMVMGRPIGEPIDSYYQYYAYEGRFMGWHWREYTLKEFAELFTREQFQIVSARHLTVFQNRPQKSFIREAWHFVNQTVCLLIPSCGTNCALALRK